MGSPFWPAQNLISQLMSKTSIFPSLIWICQIAYFVICTNLEFGNPNEAIQNFESEIVNIEVLDISLEVLDEIFPFRKKNSILEVKVRHLFTKSMFNKVYYSM